MTAEDGLLGIEIACEPVELESPPAPFDGARHVEPGPELKYTISVKRGSAAAERVLAFVKSLVEV